MNLQNYIAKINRYVKKHFMEIFAGALSALGFSLAFAVAMTSGSLESRLTIPMIVGVIAMLVSFIVMMPGNRFFGPRRTVFLSSRQHDEYARKLKSELMKQPRIDVKDFGSVKLGEEIETAVENLIKNSDVLIYVISGEDFLYSSIEKNMTFALENGKKVIPVVLEKVCPLLPDKFLKTKGFIFSDANDMTSAAEKIAKSIL